MRSIPISPAKLCTLVVGFTLSLAVQSAEPSPGPCDQIKAACKQKHPNFGEGKKAPPPPAKGT
jgi:hypothetical protein